MRAGNQSDRGGAGSPGVWAQGKGFSGHCLPGTVACGILSFASGLWSRREGSCVVLSRRACAYLSQQP